MNCRSLVSMDRLTLYTSPNHFLLDFDRLGSTKCLLAIRTAGRYPSTMVASHGVLNSEVCFLEKPFSPDVLRAKVSEMLAA